MKTYQIKKAVRLLFAIIIFFWIIGFFIFSYNVHNVTHNDRHMTDAIVTIGGKKQNLYSSVQLLKFGYAPIVFVTGNKPKSDYEEFFIENHVLPEQFVFDYAITGSNANDSDDVVAFLNFYNFYSARIVANAYQMPRLVMDIKSKIKSDITIIPHPISIKQQNYTKLFIEYLKYSFVFLLSLSNMGNLINLSYS